MTGGERILAGGPLVYPLRAESTIGGEVYEERLLRRLPLHGVDLVLGLPRGHDHAQPPDGWRVATLPDRSALPWPAHAAAFVPFVVRLLRAGRVDLLRGASIRLTGPALLAGRALVGGARRTPVVLHQHHLEPRWARVEAAIIAPADATITVSERSKAALVALGVPAERLHVVPDGIDAGPTTPDPWPEAWPPGDGLRLLYLGRLEERKRPRVAVEAAALTGARLVVAGEGPLRPQLERLAREQSVPAAFRGRVSDAAKWRLYDGADLLLFPSDLEGFGIVVAEAQSRGLPVVAAAGTGTEATLADGRSGLLVPSTPDAFADAIRTLANPDTRTAMSQAAREHARRFDWDATAAAVAAIYRDLVGRA